MPGIGVRRVPRGAAAWFSGAAVVGLLLVPARGAGQFIADDHCHGGASSFSWWLSWMYQVPLDSERSFHPVCWGWDVYANVYYDHRPHYEGWKVFFTAQHLQGTDEFDVRPNPNMFQESVYLNEDNFEVGLGYTMDLALICHPTIGQDPSKACRRTDYYTVKVYRYSINPDARISFLLEATHAPEPATLLLLGTGLGGLAAAAGRRRRRSSG